MEYCEKGAINSKGIDMNDLIIVISPEPVVLS
jgi:hypothetical protein